MPKFARSRYGYDQIEVVKVRVRREPSLGLQLEEVARGGDGRGLVLVAGVEPGGNAEATGKVILRLLRGNRWSSTRHGGCYAGHVHAHRDEPRPRATFFTLACLSLDVRDNLLQAAQLVWASLFAVLFISCARFGVLLRSTPAIPIYDTLRSPCLLVPGAVSYVCTRRSSGIPSKEHASTFQSSSTDPSPYSACSSVIKPTVDFRGRHALLGGR